MPNNNNFLGGFFNFNRPLNSSLDNRSSPSLIRQDDLNMFSNFQDDFSNRLRYVPRSIPNNNFFDLNNNIPAVNNNNVPANPNNRGIYAQFEHWIDNRPRVLPDIYSPAPPGTLLPSYRSSSFVYDSLRPFRQVLYEDFLFFFTNGPSLDFVIFSSLSGVVVLFGFLLSFHMPSFLIPFVHTINRFATISDRPLFLILGIGPKLFSYFSDLYARYRGRDRVYRTTFADFSYSVLAARPPLFYHLYYLYSTARIYILDRWLF